MVLSTNFSLRVQFHSLELYIYMLQNYANFGFAVCVMYFFFCMKTATFFVSATTEKG